MSDMNRQECEMQTKLLRKMGKPQPLVGRLNLLVKWFLFGLKWCLRIPMACIFWGFVACCLAIGKFAEGVKWLYDWTNKTT